MRFQLRALVASAIALLAIPIVGVSAKPRLPKDYAAWARVASCESGGWRVLGHAYPDSLGINRVNYLRFGGTPLPVGSVSLKEQIVQIKVADRLIAAYGASIPDQYGCAAW